MNPLQALLWFDVEDFMVPESEWALEALLAMLDRLGIPAVFKVVGEKARNLEAHGRRDLLGGMAAHEVGYHTDMHSRHPTVTEYLEHYGFADGAEEFERRERAGFRDVERLIGAAIRCYGQPGYAWAPQVFPVLRDWGIDAYLDDHDVICLGGQPFWYGGLLNLTCLEGFFRVELVPNGLEAALTRFDAFRAEESSSPVRFISIVYHPCEFVEHQFPDELNFGGGVNRCEGEWLRPPLRSPHELRELVDSLERFLEYSSQYADYVTTAEVIASERELCDRVPARTAGSAEEAKRLATGLYDELSFMKPIDRYRSPAEVFMLLRDAITAGRSGLADLTQPLYGPEHDAPSTGDGTVTPSDLRTALGGMMQERSDVVQLPDLVRVGAAMLNPVDLTCTMAAAIRARAADRETIPVIRGRLSAADHVRDDEAWGPRWPIFDPGLRVPNIVRMARLQSWTLRPSAFAASMGRS